MTGFLGGLDLVAFCYADEKTVSFPASLFQVWANSHTLPCCLGSQALNCVTKVCRIGGVLHLHLFKVLKITV